MEAVLTCPLWSSVTSGIESVCDILNVESPNSKESVGYRPDKSSESGLGRTDSEADITNPDTLYGSASVWLPCYDVDADVCSGSERSFEDTYIFDSPEIECLAPNMPMHSPLSLTDEKSSTDHEIKCSKSQFGSIQENTISHLVSEAERFERHRRPSKIVAVSIKSESPSPSDRFSEDYGSSHNGAESCYSSCPLSSRVNDQTLVSIGRPRQATFRGLGVESAGHARQNRSVVHGSNFAGGATAVSVSATAAARNPKTCAYEGCPCPMQSNKWRTVTSGTAAGQQVKYFLFTYA